MGIKNHGGIKEKGMKIKKQIVKFSRRMNVYWKFKERREERKLLEEEYESCVQQRGALEQRNIELEEECRRKEKLLKKERERIDRISRRGYTNLPTVRRRLEGNGLSKIEAEVLMSYLPKRADVPLHKIIQLTNHGKLKGNKELNSFLRGIIKDPEIYPYVRKIRDVRIRSSGKTEVRGLKRGGVIYLVYSLDQRSVDLDVHTSAINLGESLFIANLLSYRLGIPLRKKLMVQ